MPVQSRPREPHLPSTLEQGYYGPHPCLDNAHNSRGRVPHHHGPRGQRVVSHKFPFDASEEGTPLSMLEVPLMTSVSIHSISSMTDSGMLQHTQATRKEGADIWANSDASLFSASLKSILLSPTDSPLGLQEVRGTATQTRPMQRCADWVSAGVALPQLPRKGGHSVLASLLSSRAGSSDFDPVPPVHFGPAAIWLRD
jgi:hypothetical protein